MGELLSGLAGENAASALFWTVAALLVLVVVLIIARLMRNYRSGTFIAGGRNRVPRLAVVDAIAVDSQRRLVLVRRDDAEHLLLIGGSNDVVVEPQIRARGPEADTAQRRLRQNVSSPAPSLSPVPQQRPAAARPSAPAPRPAPQRPMQAAAIAQEHQPPARTEPEMTEAPPSPVPAPRDPQMPRAEANLWAAPGARQEPEIPVPAKANAAGEPEQAEEHGITADRQQDRAARDEEAPSREPELSIESEMSRLLDDLSEERGKKG